MAEFQEFEKIPRLSRVCTITEKIDGTNGVIYIGDDPDFDEFLVGSKSRWLQPGKATDNFGFARWAYEHKDELLTLGPGYHYGEWWGLGIQRGYAVPDKRFSLFNTFRWSDAAGVRPACCGVVPVLFEGLFETHQVDIALDSLAQCGSLASLGFMQPEGIVIYHHAAKQYFKKTILKDEAHKG